MVAYLKKLYSHKLQLEAKRPSIKYLMVKIRVIRTFVHVFLKEYERKMKRAQLKHGVFEWYRRSEAHDSWTERGQGRR